MMQPKFLFFAGSARKDSIHKKLALISQKFAENQGVETTFLDLRDYPLPIYDGDLESTEGMPSNAIRLKDIFSQHQGWLIASPEYNSSFSPLLKNTIDWMSRPHSKDEAMLSVFQNKVSALIAASPGGFGGIRG